MNLNGADGIRERHAKIEQEWREELGAARPNYLRRLGVDSGEIPTSKRAHDFAKFIERAGIPKEKLDFDFGDAVNGPRENELLALGRGHLQRTDFPTWERWYGNTVTAAEFKAAQEAWYKDDLDTRYEELAGITEKTVALLTELGIPVDPRNPQLYQNRGW